LSDNSVGNTPVSGAFCQCEAELHRCEAVKNPLASTPGSDLAFANQMVFAQAESEFKKEIPVYM
jgi:hypothetical protein